MRTICYILFLAIATATSAQVSGLSHQYIAGDAIHFYYAGSPQPLKLIITHSYGTYTLPGISDNNSLLFTLPKHITTKTGEIDLRIIQGGRCVWKGKTEVTPKTDGNTLMEAYCGPKHLVVNKNDFSMLTATVLDEFDNPFPENTQLGVSALIDQKKRTDSISMHGLIAFDRIYASDKKGYGAVFTAFEDVSSKEFRLDFYTNDPTPFELLVSRQHTYADGLQLVVFQTSEIKDNLGNQMEDGTLVSFEITDSKGQKTIAYASTIDGKAKIELPAPSFPTTWTAQADIATYSQSNIKEIAFVRSLKSIPTQQTKGSLTIGPLKSYMEQLIKEGQIVKITLKNAKRTTTYSIATEEGHAVLDFKKQLVLPGAYEAVIEVGGISKNIKLEVADD